jgi:AraC family transcriptional regulator
MPNSKIDRCYKRLGLPNPPTLVTSVSRGAPITFARIRLDCAGRTFDGILADDSYTFHVNFLKQMPFSAAFTKKRAPERYLLREGDSAMMDRREPVAAATMYSPLDTVRLYLPCLTLQDFVRERSGSNEVHLKPTEQALRDPILYNLGACLSALLEHPEEDNSLLVDHIALAFQSHLYQTYSATPVWDPKPHGGLSPWQVSRAKEAIDASLHKGITIAQLAHDCRLSATTFARAFKQSTGYPPHRWLLQRRIERAQDLLLTSDKTIAEIASACGYRDQSHLARAFTQAIGTSPRLWRRAKRI